METSLTAVSTPAAEEMPEIFGVELWVPIMVVIVGSIVAMYALTVLARRE